MLFVGMYITGPLNYCCVFQAYLDTVTSLFSKPIVSLTSQVVGVRNAYHYCYLLTLLKPSETASSSAACTSLTIVYLESCICL